MSYDMIDRFLRNNLGDDDYAEYSAALDALCASPPQRESVTIDRACFERGCACFNPRVDKDFVIVEKRS